MRTFAFLLIAFFGSCSTTQEWQLSSIQSGETLSRLSYRPHDSFSGVSLEICAAHGSVTGNLCTMLHRFDPNTTHAHIQWGEQHREIPIFIHEGNMKASLPDEALAEIVGALQEGHEVSMVIGSFEQVLQPGQFSQKYQQLTKKSAGFLPSIQGFWP